MIELVSRPGRATRSHPAAEPAFISVIVPVRNEARFIRHTLGQLLAQNYPADRFEVLVADGRSDDATPMIVREMSAAYPNVALLDNPKRWSSAGRNAAVRAARGDIIVLIDGHCELDNPSYLADLADAFERSGADCVGRPQPLQVPGAAPLHRAVAAARASRLGVAYRRSVFGRIGLFDESFDACEDVDFNHRLDRAGLRCFFTPRVAVRYHPRGTLAGLFRQMVRYGRGRVRLLAKHPDTFSARGFVPAAFVLGLIAGPPLAALSPWLAGLYAGALGVYVLVVALASLLMALRARDWRLLPWLPLVFLAIHCGAGTGMLVEGVAAASRRAAHAAGQIPSVGASAAE